MLCSPEGLCNALRLSALSALSYFLPSELSSVLSKMTSDERTYLAKITNWNDFMFQLRVYDGSLLRQFPYLTKDLETLKKQYRLASTSITSSSTSTTTLDDERRYDVFINHYKHPLGRVIYEELDAMGLKVFLNSEELQLEDEKVQRAITSAWLCIPIFSEDSAQSSRCLEELSAIRTRKDAKIVPIFSHVKPDDVRYAKGVYAAAFPIEVEHNSEKLQKWKEALYSVSHHTGLEVNSEEDKELLLKKIPDWAVKDRELVEEFGSDVLSRRDHLSHTLFEEYETLSARYEKIGQHILERLVFKDCMSPRQYSCCFTTLLSIWKRRNVIRETHRAIRKENARRKLQYEMFRLACDQLMKIDEEEYTRTESAESRRECRVPVRSDLNYDVFINHRGPDVKETVATDIYKKLKAMGLKPFLDKYELRGGDHIPSVLEKVMKSAKLHIAIFSENYARSKWCLRELSFMQSETYAQIIPVFYYCKLKDVRHSKGVFGKAFEAYKKKGRIALEKLRKWQEMLYRASFNLGPRLNSKEEEATLLKVIPHLCNKFLNVHLEIASCKRNSIQNLLYHRGVSFGLNGGVLL